MPTRNPNTVLDTARQDWADWLPGDGTAYRVRIIPINGGPHGRTEHARRLSYRCGWLIPQDTDPAGRSARIAAVPALIRTQLAPADAWHLLDSLDELGRPIGMPRLADPAEVAAAGMDPALTLDEALTQLHAARGAA